MRCDDRLGTSNRVKFPIIFDAAPRGDASATELTPTTANKLNTTGMKTERFISPPPKRIGLLPRRRTSATAISAPKKLPVVSFLTVENCYR
jgi:hypothetical protein